MTDLELCRKAKMAILASELLDREGRTADSILVMAGLVGMIAGEMERGMKRTAGKMERKAQWWKEIGPLLLQGVKGALSRDTLENLVNSTGRREDWFNPLKDAWPTLKTKGLWPAIRVLSSGDPRASVGLIQQIIDEGVPEELETNLKKVQQAIWAGDPRAMGQLKKLALDNHNFEYFGGNTSMFPKINNSLNVSPYGKIIGMGALGLGYEGYEGLFSHDPSSLKTPSENLPGMPGGSGYLPPDPNGMTNPNGARPPTIPGMPGEPQMPIGGYVANAGTSPYGGMDPYAMDPQTQAAMATFREQMNRYYAASQGLGNPQQGDLNFGGTGYLPPGSMS